MCWLGLAALSCLTSISTEFDCPSRRVKSTVSPLHSCLSWEKNQSWRSFTAIFKFTPTDQKAPSLRDKWRNCVRLMPTGNSEYTKIHAFNIYFFPVLKNSLYSLILFKFCSIQSTVSCGLSHYSKRDRRLQVRFQEAIKVAQIFKYSLCRPEEFILLHIIRLSLFDKYSS